MMKIMLILRIVSSIIKGNVLDPTDFLLCLRVSFFLILEYGSFMLSKFLVT